MSPDSAIVFASLTASGSDLTISECVAATECNEVDGPSTSPCSVAATARNDKLAFLIASAILGAVVPIRIGNTIVERKVITNIIGFFVIYILIAVFGVLVMSFLGLDLPTSIGAVAATINNIGPGLGNVGPTDNYSAIPDVGKWLLSFLMLIGRLEVFTVIILFAPSYWKK